MKKLKSCGFRCGFSQLQDKRRKFHKSWRFCSHNKFPVPPKKAISFNAVPYRHSIFNCATHSEAPENYLILFGPTPQVRITQNFRWLRLAPSSLRAEANYMVITPGCPHLKVENTPFDSLHSCSGARKMSRQPH
jgi:hypothetical protein